MGWQVIWVAQYLFFKKYLNDSQSSAVRLESNPNVVLLKGVLTRALFDQYSLLDPNRSPSCFQVLVGFWERGCVGDPVSLIKLLKTAWCVGTTGSVVIEKFMIFLLQQPLALHIWGIIQTSSQQRWVMKLRCLEETVAEETERTNIPFHSTELQSLMESDLSSYPDIESLTEDDLKKDGVRIKLVQGSWDHCHKFKFPSKDIRGNRESSSTRGLWTIND